MMVIDWDGTIYRNENALKKLHAMWRQSFDVNVQTLVPVRAMRRLLASSQASTSALR